MLNSLISRILAILEFIKKSFLRCSVLNISFFALLRTTLISRFDAIYFGAHTSYKVKAKTKIVSNSTAITGHNKKLRYREEHSASVVLSWCTF